MKKVNKLENDLAVSQQVSDDSMVYIFKIREDAKFSDGNVLTAEDVVFTFETSMQKASAADLIMLDKVEAKDTYTVAFYLKHPWSTFPFVLSEVGIVPKHAYNENYGDNPIGSGAWKVADFKKDQQLVLVPNEHYYGKKPNFKKVTILKLDEDAALAGAKSGQLDLVLVDSEFDKTKVEGMKLLKMKAIDAFVVNLPTVAESQDGENIVGNNVTNDPAIRKALNIGIDRQTIVNNSLSGIGETAYGAIADLPWSNSNVFSDNKIQEAKEILEKAGWLDSDSDGIREKNGVKAEFVVAGRSNDQVRYNTVVALAENAKQFGINIIHKSAPWVECRVARATPTCWVFGKPNPIEFYRYYHSSQIGKSVIGNPASYSNMLVDENINQ